ncbi:MAG: hypothetical protein A2431_00385 [Candidatus Zambryskibacteria bacterium RIFOXYC1_FULL_39_10]|uniref:Uncharacterized protein n=1 Tax=Candidatus Zambryskibacteria bacterium RIFOXYC1_FULL_39_10 TaxID=1802779 RepID=A0A1G2UZG6_9BACT|nr:MAG: hypothetical protein A2431_00385 [Candidatus Zambryskibacteria bacterium RIFOXYC1_FULL_39_10]OHB16004.1 MAG: hypothetical protein A2605_03925 [Candidatus Zambryskibacteria bacterium RIFOXYD1_FULL_39_35]
MLIETWLGIAPLGFPRIHLVFQPKFLLEAALFDTGGRSTTELPRNAVFLNKEHDYVNKKYKKCQF